MGGHGQKWVTPFRSYGTLKSGASHIWFDELSRLIEWFLHADSDSIIFGLTTNPLCIFDICWCPLQLYLLRMMFYFLSSAHRKSFRTWFSQMFFNKSLIKCGKIISCLMQYWKKYGKWPDTLKPQNFKILPFLLYGYLTSQLKNIAIPATAFSCHSFNLLPIC